MGSFYLLYWMVTGGRLGSTTDRRLNVLCVGLIRHFIVRASSKLLYVCVCTYGTTCCFTSFNPLVKSHQYVPQIFRPISSICAWNLSFTYFLVLYYLFRIRFIARPTQLTNVHKHILSAASPWDHKHDNTIWKGPILAFKPITATLVILLNSSP